jgi:endonuclease-3 related protein
VNLQAVESWFRVLFDRYGPQSWWPGDSAFEIMLGAVIVQRTTWSNATRALRDLSAAHSLTAAELVNVPLNELGALLRPAGFTRSKPRRVVELARFIERSGGLELLRGMQTSHLRSELLNVDGIGAETADAILLYAFGRPVFVVDAYARRLFGRLDASMTSDDAVLKAEVESRILDVSELNEFHALIVAHGKKHCRKKPVCAGCCLSAACDYFAGGEAGANDPGA